MLRVALPNDGRLAEPASRMLREAGYLQRTDSRDLSFVDEENGIEFFYLQARDIATYVGSGNLQLGITGQDLTWESGSHVRTVAELGFGASQCRFAVPETSGWTVADLDGRTIATSYPQLVRSCLSGKGIGARIIRVDGDAEQAVRLGLADAIAEIVPAGCTLRQHGLRVIGDPIMSSEAVLIEREPRPDRVVSPLTRDRMQRFAARVRARAHAHRYVMINYWCRPDDLDSLQKISPRLRTAEGVTAGRDDWVVVPSMVLRSDFNTVVDELELRGALAVSSNEMHAFRSFGQPDPPPRDVHPAGPLHGQR